MIAAAALCAALAACVPLASFERPATAAEGVDAEPDVSGPTPPPDLPEPGDSPAAAVESAPAGAPAEEPRAQAGLESQPAPQEPASEPAQPAPVEGAPSDPAQAEPAKPPSADEAHASEVRAQLESFYQAYNARDWKRARTFFWGGATITDVRPLPDPSVPVVKVSTVAEFFDALGPAPESGPLGFEGRLEGEPLVRTASNVAQAWCLFEARFGSEQESMSWRRVDAFTFVRHEGAWKIASLALSKSFDVPESR